MATNVLTLPGESLETFLDALKGAVRAFLKASLPAPHIANGACQCPCCVCEQPWLICPEATTGEKVVVEARYDNQADTYTSIDYTRDMSTGEFAFVNPIPVREVKVYMPIEGGVAPAPGMAQVVAVAPEALASSVAPAGLADLTVGSPIQLLREGALYDRSTGMFVLSVTPELCTDIAASVAKTNAPIPVDFGHALYLAQVEGKPQDTIPLFGRLSQVEARPGTGLWGTPEWTAQGVELLANNPGMMYVSPTLMPASFDPATGAALPGRGVHSVSLTPTPKQDRLAAVTLAAAPVAAPLEQQHPAPKAVEPGLTGLTLAETVAKVETLTLANTALTTEVAALKAEKLAMDFTSLFAQHTARGVVLADTLKAELRVLPIKQAGVILSHMVGERPLPLGHGTIVDATPETPMDRDLRIITTATKKNISLVQAAKEIQ